VAVQLEMEKSNERQKIANMQRFRARIDAQVQRARLVQMFT
jgi:hypothetical protein